MVRLKHRSLWDIQATNKSPWLWNKIQEELRNDIKIQIGNGKDTFLWYKDDPLIQKYGERITYNSNLGKYAQVSVIVDGNR